MDEDVVVQVKESFGEYLDLLDERKGLNDQISEVVDKAATVLSMNKSMTRKLFNAMKKRMEGNDELEELKEYLDELV